MNGRVPISRRTRPLGLALLVSAVVVSAAGAREMWRTRTAFELRIWWIGYDGCRCDDCANGLGFGPPPHRGCSPAPTEGEIVGQYGVGAAVLTLAGLLLPRTIGAWERRRANGSICPACGYDLTGLPHRRCPECGRTWG